MMHSTNMKRMTKDICPNLMVFCSDIFFLKLTYINMSYSNEGMQNNCLVCENLCCLYLWNTLLCLEDFAAIEFVEIFSADRGVRWFKSTDFSETDFIFMTRFLMFGTEPISETVVDMNNLIRLSARKGFTEISECLTYIFFSPLLFYHEDGGSVFTRKLGTICLTPEYADIFKFCNRLVIWSFEGFCLFC